MEEQHPTIPAPEPTLVKVEILFKSGATVTAKVADFTVRRNGYGEASYEWKHAPGHPKLMFLDAADVVSVVTDVITPRF